MNTAHPILLASGIDEHMRRAESVEFCPQHFAQFWPEHLPLPPSVVPGRLSAERTRMGRKQLRALGQAVSDPASALDFYAAVCAYGSGTQARSVSRGLRAPAVGGFANTVAELIERGRGRSGAECFALWHHSVPFVGPSTFTKLMAFSQPQRRQAGSPAVLDGRILKAIGWDTAVISARLYAEYTELITAVAALADTSIDDVESVWTARGIDLLTHRWQPALL